MAQSLREMMFGKGRGDNAVEQEKQRIKKLEEEERKRQENMKKKGALSTDMEIYS